METAYLHFILLGKLLYLFQNIADMKIAIFKEEFLNEYIYMFLHTPYTYNKVVV